MQLLPGISQEKCQLSQLEQREIYYDCESIAIMYQIYCCVSIFVLVLPHSVSRCLLLASCARSRLMIICGPIVCRSQLSVAVFARLNKHSFQWRKIGKKSQVNASGLPRGHHYGLVRFSFSGLRDAWKLLDMTETAHLRLSGACSNS